MRRLSKYAVLFGIGAVVYFEIELNWRYFADTLPVHWTMPLLGATVFILIGGLNNWLPWDLGFLWQCLLGGTIATVAEFIAGCILNLWLGLGIWDYSHIPFNIMGQICLPFFFAWVLVAAVAIVLDDWLRYKLYGEERPHYTLI